MTFTNDGDRRAKAGRFARDFIERVLATAAQAAIAYVVVESAGWPTWIAVPLTTAAAAVKGWLAKHVGNKDSASLATGV